MLIYYQKISPYMFWKKNNCCLEYVYRQCFFHCRYYKILHRMEIVDQFPDANGTFCIMMGCKDRNKKPIPDELGVRAGWLFYGWATWLLCGSCVVQKVLPEGTLAAPGEGAADPPTYRYLNWMMTSGGIEPERPSGDTGGFIPRFITQAPLAQREKTMNHNGTGSLHRRTTWLTKRRWAPGLTSGWHCAHICFILSRRAAPWGFIKSLWIYLVCVCKCTSHYHTGENKFVHTLAELVFVFMCSQLIKLSLVKHRHTYWRWRKTNRTHNSHFTNKSDFTIQHWSHL